MKQFDWQRFEFRDIRPEEWAEAAQIEQICFPPNEACSAASMRDRAERSAETFLVAYDRVNHKIAGFLNGLPTDEEVFRDDFFTDISQRNPAGKNVMLLGLDVRPEYRHRGLATTLMDCYMDREAEKGREQLILTCLPHLVDFYRGLGFCERGISASVWGGEQWMEMSAAL